MLENLLGITVSDKYDTLVTVAFLAVVFYSISFAKDAAMKLVGEHVLAKKLDELIGILARQTGQSRDEVRAVLDSKFSKPALIKKWVSDSIDFFRPSKNAGNVPILVGGAEIDRETVMAVPAPILPDAIKDFDRYTPYSSVPVQIHAMDKDKGSTGWAAVVPEVSEKRFKMKVLPPLSPADLFGKSEIVGSIVVVSKLTANGFVPSEIHLTAIDS